MSTSPIKIGVYQDNVLTVDLKTSIYSYSSLLTESNSVSNHTLMSNSSSSLLELELDQQMVNAVFTAYFDK